MNKEIKSSMLKDIYTNISTGSLNIILVKDNRTDEQIEDENAPNYCPGPECSFCVMGKIMAFIWNEDLDRIKKRNFKDRWLFKFFGRRLERAAAINNRNAYVIKQSEELLDPEAIQEYEKLNNVYAVQYRNLLIKRDGESPDFIETLKSIGRKAPFIIIVEEPELLDKRVQEQLLEINTLENRWKDLLDSETYIIALTCDEEYFIMNKDKVKSAFFINAPYDDYCG